MTEHVIRRKFDVTDGLGRVLPVEVEVDVSGLARDLARAAWTSKGKKATEASGRIVVRPVK